MNSQAHFAHVADSGARCYWSHTGSPEFSGHHGVGLVLSSASPFGEATDSTAGVYRETLKNRYLLLKTTLGDRRVYIHVVYAPQTDTHRGEFFRALPTCFNDGDEDEEEDCASHIVLGDFNVTMDDMLDQLSPDHKAGRGRDELNDWLDALGLVDAWRFINPDERDFTSPTRKNRIDYCFLTADLLQYNLDSVTHIKNRTWLHEDHVPVEFRLQAKFLPRLSKPQWRCPPWLLQDKEVQTYLSESLDSLADRIKIFPGANPGCLLDEHKRTDCIYLRERWQDLRRKDSRKMAAKVEEFNAAQDLYNLFPTETNKEALEQARIDLQAHREDIKERNSYKKFGADLHLSERATSHFFRPPQQDCVRSPITGLQQVDGTVTENPREIAEGHRKFWGTLFQSTSPDLRRLRTSTYQPLKLQRLLRETTARLTASQQALLDAPITAHDYYWAIMKSQNGKAPGPDGLPIEYYKLAPSRWARIYEVIYDNQLSRGKMTKFQRRAHLSLLYKAGNRNLPGNYRPLTLLNHDAKLGPKILQRRLGEVLPSIIHEDQSGFVPERSIRHTLLRFQDLQDICRRDHPDACAVLLDFAKAFDSVLWPALDVVLQHFGFGSTFRAWVKTFYKETSVSLLFNDCPGTPFLLGAGVRQGDPLSPGLFVVFVEPMMNYLRARFSSRGIVVNDWSSPHLLLAFADDCTGLLSSVEDAEQFLELVQEYADAAGLRLNVNKTCVMPFSHHVDRGKLDRLRENSGLKVLTPWETVKLLGILQGATITPDQRFADSISKMRARCAIWKYRARTLRGKVVLLQNIILPILWYTTSVTPPTKGLLQTVDVLIRNFVNGGDPDAETAKPGKFDKGWIYTRVSIGGLGLKSPKAFITATHLKSLRDGIATTELTGKAPRWIEPALALFSYALGALGEGFDILYANMKSARWGKLSDFWRFTLQQWTTLQASLGSVNWKEHVLEMPFWNNIRLLFGKLARPLCELHPKNMGTILELGCHRIQDFVAKYGSHVTTELLETLLDVNQFASPAPRTRLINTVVAIFDSIQPDSDPFIGPPRLAQITAAFHEWSFEGVQVHKLANRDFVKLMLKIKPTVPPDLPLRQLQLSNFTLQDNTWTQEYVWDRHILPVCSDLKFRLQHNALGVRYKFGYRTRGATSTLCIHDCDIPETAIHLFWHCPVARYQWEYYLMPFESLIEGEFGWQTVLFAGTIRYSSSAKDKFGILTLQVIFSIIRCCVFRSLWLHRNKKLYNPALATSAPWVRRHAYAYVKLHLHKYREHLLHKGATAAIGLVNYVSNALRMDLRSMTMAMTLALDVLHPAIEDVTQA